MLNFLQEWFLPMRLYNSRISESSNLVFQPQPMIWAASLVSASQLLMICWMYHQFHNVLKQFVCWTPRTPRQHDHNNAPESHLAVSWGSGRIISRGLLYSCLRTWHIFLQTFWLHWANCYQAQWVLQSVNIRLACLAFTELSFARWSTLVTSTKIGFIMLFSCSVLYMIWVFASPFALWDLKVCEGFILVTSSMKMRDSILDCAHYGCKQHVLLQKLYSYIIISN